MAQRSRIPVAPPPTPPARESTGRLLLRGQITLTMFAVLAHTAVFNLFGAPGAGVVLGVLLIGALATAIPGVVRGRPTRFPWRRLPWVALAYVAFALLSLLWSRWPQATAITWVLQAGVTVVALFAASALSWQEIVRSLSSALKWILGLSLALELWVSLRGTPLLPNFASVPTGKIDPQWYWVRGNLFDGGRLQGIVGNANTLAFLCVLALIVFGVLFVARVRRRGALIGWLIVAAFLLLRASSATAYACAAAVAVVLVMTLLMRRTRRPGERTRLYVAFGGLGLLGAAALWFGRDAVFGALGRSSDLTGRLGIWGEVAARGAERPIAGNGFSSPWVPWDPAFDGWIIDHGITVFHAHEMWLDVFLQLGAIGVALMAVAFLAMTWRAWFFAVDRPRWDLREERPYAAIALLPILVTTMLLVQGLVESGPIMLWGWMLVVLLSFKMKAVPLVGRGLSERDRTVETGTPARRAP
ncbi:O-antigen ligase [Microbacterium resistens]|uniref:O-antigen ligase n=1 Tax=Microbacterium resistens TaxID=156977 RepID=A0ABU1S9Q0_9MICO|nr:O-antigen ligase family protein [Microbacterium resistens]MDR6866341.1 O-antigen ligase [Microbacterium resistens]